jgi:hypothetical protein
MWQANPTWSSRRIVGELRKLGIAVAKSTVEKYCPRSKKPPSPTWKTFLKDHVQDLVALDCFIVPTVTVHVLLALVILAHERRRIVHFNILSLAMDCPNARPIQPPACGQVIAGPKAGGLHHHDERVAA